MRRAGTGAIGGGRWLADTVVEMIPHIPVRDRATLQEHHGGASGAALAGELIRNAARATAAVGATTGALAAVEDMSPPAWIVLPLELALETGITGLLLVLPVERSSMGRGTMRSMVEGLGSGADSPSTALRAVPLPMRYARRED